jgi:hypothetical protein
MNNQQGFFHFSFPNGSTELKIWIAIGFILSCAFVASLFFAPKALRRPIVVFGTFIGGFYFILKWLWPAAQDYKETEIPRNVVERVSFNLEYLLPFVSSFTQVLAALLLGLGISSLVRIHFGQLMKKHRDWFFSFTLLSSMVAMAIIGIWDWAQRLGPGAEEKIAESPYAVTFVKDLLFDGLLINLDAVMFSIIAFFIFSAAYRAFRIRSVESTILLTVALIVMLSLMGAIVSLCDIGVDKIASSTGLDSGGFMDNFRLTTVKAWIQDTLQIPSIRAMDLGLAVGGLAMSLRLWLSIEKGVSN